MVKETAYVGFNEQDFIEARKAILNSMMGTLKLLKKQESYKELRKNEKELKQEFKKEIKETNSEINGFISSLPSIRWNEKVETGAGIKNKTKESIERAENYKKTKTRLDAELQDIRKKLASL